MQIIHQVTNLQLQLARRQSIAFVPTMGNLHAGHLALVEQARRLADCVVVSIFVNPLQFGPQEDFAAYPRTLAADCQALQDLADIVFAPSETELYPEPQSIFIELPPMAATLCGAHRPGHFRGMATVVLKLLHLVNPTYTVLGKKDYQQLQLIRQLVRQLNVRTQIIGSETVRAADGLALSSRNQYLSASERVEASVLYRTLSSLRDHLLAGGSPSTGEAQAINTLTQRGWQVEYIAVRNQLQLLPPTPTDTELVILGAARLGKTRLIDNLEVCL